MCLKSVRWLIIIVIHQIFCNFVWRWTEKRIMILFFLVDFLLLFWGKIWIWFNLFVASLICFCFVSSLSLRNCCWIFPLCRILILVFYWALTNERFNYLDLKMLSKKGSEIILIFRRRRILVRWPAWWSHRRILIRIIFFTICWGRLPSSLFLRSLLS